MRLRSKYRVMITLRSLDTGSMGSSVNSMILPVLDSLIDDILEGRTKQSEEDK